MINVCVELRIRGGPFVPAVRMQAAIKDGCTAADVVDTAWSEFNELFAGQGQLANSGHTIRLFNDSDNSMMTPSNL